MCVLIYSHCVSHPLGSLFSQMKLLIDKWIKHQNEFKGKYLVISSITWMCDECQRTSRGEKNIHRSAKLLCRDEACVVMKMFASILHQTNRIIILNLLLIELRHIDREAQTKRRCVAARSNWVI